MPTKFKDLGKNFSIVMKSAVTFLKICNFTLYFPRYLCAQLILEVCSVQVKNKKISFFIKFLNINNLILTILYLKKIVSFLHLLF